MEYTSCIGTVILFVFIRIASSQLLQQTTPAPLYDVRLTNGPTAAEGLVEVSQSGSGQWVALCDYQVDIRIASVVCRQLDYDLALGTDGDILEDGYGNRALFSILSCRGYETSLTQCYYRVGIGDSRTCHYAGVRCGNYSEPFDIRLVDGPTSSEGRLEVHHQGIWGTVCDDGFEIREANVACQQLGYDYAVEVQNETFGGQGDGNILLDDIDCIGNEKLLSRCKLKGWGTHDCSPSEDVGVRCGNLEGEDMPISLTNSRNNLGNRGNVLVFFNGSWGNICLNESNWDDWGIEEANVACRQLGYEEGARSYRDHRASYEPGTPPVVSYIDCIGDESNLAQCKVKGFDSQVSYFEYAATCNYRQATVICQTDTEGLTNGKIAGITVTCILLVIMLVVIPLVILRCKKPKTIESQTTEGLQQANGTTNAVPSQGVLTQDGETTVMYMSSPTGPSQVMIPYGSPAVAYGHNGNILYQHQPLLVQQSSHSQPQTIVAPIYQNGVQLASGTGYFTDMDNVSTQRNKLSSVSETGAAGGGGGDGLGSNEHTVEDKVPLV